MASWFTLFGFGSITGRIAGFGGWLDFVLFYGLYTIVMVVSFLVILQFDISESYMSLYPVIFLHISPAKISYETEHDCIIQFPQIARRTTASMCR